MLSMLKYPPAHTLLLEDVLLHPQDKGNEREEETDIRCREQFKKKTLRSNSLDFFTQNWSQEKAGLFSSIPLFFFASLLSQLQR